jgi:dTDP-4-dehydrorhamnose 3,5-epimerase-like enzyme
MDGPTLIQGGSAVDDRGAVGFVNDFTLRDYRRMYVVTNHQPMFVRAWHGHRHERKAAMVTAGAVLLCAVEIDDWDAPSPDVEVKRYVLSARNPAVLLLPAGYANGFMNLSAETQIAFFSSVTVEESLRDDFRYPARHWDPWSIEER